jgi:hypothetical protein
MFSPSIFFFSNRRKQKKTIEKQNAEKEGTFPSSSHFALSYLALAFALPFFPFCFKRFLLASSSSQAKEKKNHREKKKKMQKREGTFLQAPILPFHFWFSPLPSHFYPFVSNVFS